MHYLSSGIIFLFYSVNLILFTVLLIHLILHTSHHHCLSVFFTLSIHHSLSLSLQAQNPSVAQIFPCWLFLDIYSSPQSTLTRCLMIALRLQNYVSIIVVCRTFLSLSHVLVCCISSMNSSASVHAAELCCLLCVNIHMVVW